jgi:hypothetical protein
VSLDLPLDTNQQTPAPPPQVSRAVKHCPARPLVYVVRFCGTEESSVASAIRQGIGILDSFLERQGAAPPDELVVVYRNRLPYAVTLQIGFPVEQRIANAAAGAVFAGTTPAGPMASILPGGDLADVLAVGERLPEGTPSLTWQTFRRVHFRPWREHPSVPVLAPTGLVPGTAPSHPSTDRPTLAAAAQTPQAI